MSSKTTNPAARKLVLKSAAVARGDSATQDDRDVNSEFKSFRDLARKVVAVPKKEVDEKRGKKA
jgi:hypothetical protein